MSETTVTVTSDQKPQLAALLRRLPAILAGRVADEHEIAQGFRSRLGFALLGLISKNFDDLGMGKPGVDGEVWPPLTPEYLAYGRGPDSDRHAGGYAPGKNKKGSHKDGFMTKDEYALWCRTYADRLAWFIMRESDKSAKAHAAAIAWTVVKAKGARTKLHEFGEKAKAGTDYKMLVDRGTLRRSLQQGEKIEQGNGPGGDYFPPANQVFRNENVAIVVGSAAPTASWHHNAKSPKRRRRLWPQTFPSDWWRQILGQASGGLERIAALFGASQ